MRVKDKYSPIGKKFAFLSKNQVEMGKVLGLTQQSASGKLQGKIAISVEDIQKMAEHYNVPMIWFFMPMDAQEEDARVIAKDFESSPAHAAKIARIMRLWDDNLKEALVQIAASLNSYRTNELYATKKHIDVEEFMKVE
jgi:transcriptional regulator with XRE-family HTH domain